MFNKVFNSSNIPKLNLLVTTSGLLCQIFVLNPHQVKISNQINNLEKKINNLEKIII
jgi:hypothetical protein